MSLKAQGIYENEQMQGEWKFYRETGQLWQIGIFKDNKKHGSWIKYNRDNEVGYNENFVDNKLLKKKKDNT